MPGVVLLDHVLEFAVTSYAPQGFACRIAWAKFQKPLLPDQHVLLGLEAVSAAELRFTCRVGPSRVAEGTLILKQERADE